MDKKLTFRSEADGELALTPQGFTQRFYKLNEGAFRFSKWTLELADGLVIERPQLIEGHLRIHGRIDEGRFFIGLFDKSEDYRLLNTRHTGQALTLSYDGSEWDMVAEAPGSAITLHADRDFAARILSAEAVAWIKSKTVTPDGNVSLFTPVTAEADALGRLASAILDRALDADRNGIRVGHNESDVADVIAAIRRVVTGLMACDPDRSGTQEQRRVRIAKQIEAMLWQSVDGDGSAPTSLNEFAAYFSVSERTIQFAIDDVFGTSFTKFKQRIRLHQVRDALLQSSDRGKITPIAVAHGFHHLGRFSKLYRAMFDAKPFEHVKAMRLKRTSSAS